MTVAVATYFLFLFRTKLGVDNRSKMCKKNTGNLRGYSRPIGSGTSRFTNKLFFCAVVTTEQLFVWIVHWDCSPNRDCKSIYEPAHIAR